MATSTAPEKGSRTTQAGRVPPEEQFWQRYSPHHEMPLSTIGSFLLHLLGIGGLILAAWLGWFGFNKSGAIEQLGPVRFAVQGGGGGKVNGSGNGPGIGTGAEPVETDPNADPNKTPPPENDPMRPTLDLAALKLAPTEMQKDDTFKRYVEAGNPSMKIFGTLKDSVRDKLLDGLNPGKGRGGTGQGGGQGTGTGTGDGDKTGEGTKGALSQREKRMLRWSMIFDTNSGMDYRTQLAGLGAVLAIPTGSDGRTYKIIRNLGGNGPVRLLDEDISKIQCIFWVDDRPESVASLMRSIQYPQVPNHFVAFMPLELEQELFELEKRFRGRKEEEIDSTKFRVKRTGKGYVPYVFEQKGR